MKRENMVWGVLIIIIGCLFLANNFFKVAVFSMGNLWPIFVIGPGLVFETSYFSHGRNPGLLVPGGILTTIGLLFFFEAFTNWSFSEYTWPVYVFAVAIGLFQLYLFSGRKKGLLIPIGILTAVSAFSFAVIICNGLLAWLNFNVVVGVVILILGISVLFRSARRR